MEQCLPPADAKRIKPKPLKPPHPPPKPPTPALKPPMTAPKPPMTALKPPMTAPKPKSEVNGNLIRNEMDRTAEILTPQHETKHEHLREKNNELQELNMNLQENNNTRREMQSQNEAKGAFAGMFRNAPNDKTPTFTSYITDIPSEREESRLGKQEKGGMFSGMFKKSPKPVERTLPAQEDESTQRDLPASNNSIPDVSTKEMGGKFSGMFKKPQKPPGGPAPGQANLPTQSELSDNTEDNLTTNTQQAASDDSLSGTNTKEKGGMFSRMFKRAVKPAEHTAPAQETGSVHSELSASDGSLSDGSTKDNLSTDNKLSASNESLSDVTTKGKGGKFTRMLHKASKHAAHSKESESDSDDSLSDNDMKEKGGMFSGMFKSKAPKHPKDATSALDNLSTHSELSGSNEALSDNQTSKEKKAGFSGMFKKAFKPVEPTAPAQEDESTQKKLSASNDNLTDANVKERGGVFGGMFKKHHKTSDGPTQASQSQDELSASSENLSETNTKEKAGMFSGMFRSKSDKNFEHYSHEEDIPSAHRELSASSDHLSDNTKEKGGMLTGMFRWAAKPEEHKGSAQKNESAMNRELSSSNENLLDAPSKEKGGMFSGMFRSKHPKPSQDPASDQETGLTRGELSASDDRLSENSSKEKGGKFAGMFRRGPRPAESNAAAQVSADGGAEKGGRLLRKRKTSFRVRKTLPRTPKIQSPMKDIEEEALLAEPVEMEDLGSVQGSSVEIEMLEMAPLPKDGNPLEEDDDGLLDWWRTVEGWDEWNESSNFKEDEQELAVEEAADRVYLAAQLFVRLFNQRGASLQQRILELLSLADEADNFHKRTVAASMGGGVASVVGSVTTITGLILAPFTFGTSIIVTAVGIGVATAGGIASASANITDTVHSNMDRKKVEKMIQGYQDEIKDIQECMEFVQAGMDALQEWDFEKYTESLASRALSQNVKHVVKEGARAGKALMINTDQLISTVQVLSVAGGAAKAAQAISVTTGVMSALFLALDIFFLAKDSHELRKGAKTQFATKLREVCKELQDGLLDLNRVKTELQKTMDGVEVEEFEEEEDEYDEDLDLKSDPVKLAQLEEEISLIEQKLDQEVSEKKKRVEGEERKETLKKDGKEVHGESESRETEKGENNVEDMKGEGEDGMEKEASDETEVTKHGMEESTEDGSHVTENEKPMLEAQKGAQGVEGKGQKEMTEGSAEGEVTKRGVDALRHDGKREKGELSKEEHGRDGEASGKTDSRLGSEHQSHERRPKHNWRKGTKTEVDEHDGKGKREEDKWRKHEKMERDEHRKKEPSEGEDVKDERKRSWKEGVNERERSGKEGDERRKDSKKEGDERWKHAKQEGDEWGESGKGDWDERWKSRREGEERWNDPKREEDKHWRHSHRDGDERGKSGRKGGDAQGRSGKRGQDVVTDAVPPPARPRSRAVSHVVEETRRERPAADPKGSPSVPHKKRSSQREPLSI